MNVKLDYLEKPAVLIQQGSIAVRNNLFRDLFPDVANLNQLNRYRLTSSKKEIFQKEQLFFEREAIALDDQNIIWIFNDISREYLLLQEIKKKSLHFNLIEEALNSSISFGIIIFDREKNIIFVSEQAKKLLHIPSRATMLKCFHFLKKIQECDDCFLNKKDEENGQKKKTINFGQEQITIEAVEVKDNYAYILRNTTREISLIQRIKEQQENLKKANQKISEQNEILKQLSRVSIQIGTLNDFNQILTTTIKSISEIFLASKAVLMLFAEGNKIEYASFSESFTEQEKDLFLTDFQFLKANNDFLVYDLTESEKIIGKLFLAQPQKEIDLSVIDIFLSQVSMFLKNIKLQQKLEETAFRDKMTGVFNRNYFEKKLQQEIELSKNFHQPLSLIIIDLNGLKEANDLRGHNHGDALIAAAARHLETNKGHNDTLFRLGGDEFVMICSNCDQDMLSKKIAYLKKVGKKTFYEIDNVAYFYSYSLGGACSTEISYDKIKELADQRMYEDKNEFYKTHQRYR